jgi:hypothetical protein
VTADSTRTAEQLASELIQTRLADDVFARRFGKRLQRWEVERDGFLAQVEGVLLVALLAAAEGPEAGTPESWCPAAAALLRRQDNVQLFAALPPSLPNAVRLRVDQLRLLSLGLAPHSGHRWLRLSDTAREFLVPAALLEEEK